MSRSKNLVVCCAFLGLLAACQNAPHTPPPISTALDTGAASDIAVTGRISLSTEPLPGQSAQAFIAQFHLQGSSAQGQITLQTPTGNLLAVLHWQPGSATLSQAGQADQPYADLPTLLRAVMGPAAPEPALLLAWLQGQSGSHPDWQVDLGQYASAGLIVAQCLQPLPRTHIRIKLDSKHEQ